MRATTRARLASFYQRRSASSRSAARLIRNKAPAQFEAGPRAGVASSLTVRIPAVTREHHLSLIDLARRTAEACAAERLGEGVFTVEAFALQLADWLGVIETVPREDACRRDLDALVLMGQTDAGVVEWVRNTGQYRWRRRRRIWGG